VGVLTPDEARERCQLILGNIAHARDPLHGIDGAARITLGKFIESTYGPWLKANRPRSAVQSLQRLETLFGKWNSVPLHRLTTEMFENWKIKRFSEGRMPSTITRDLATISGVLSRAVKLEKLTANVIRKVDVPRLDRNPKIRYLSLAEADRLRKALRTRDAKMRDERETANSWRRARRKELLPKLGEFADHLEPAVLLSLNTGIRRGELLSLKWSAVDLVHNTITIEGSNAKSSQTRHIPLNSEAADVLRRWKKQSSRDRIFPFTGFKTAWSALLEQATIKAFRWHDMRHDFASRLASKGVPLNTVRELLGHQSLVMTLRYAHLQPDRKAEAVSRLAEL
jgi:integrase